MAFSIQVTGNHNGIYTSICYGTCTVCFIDLDMPKSWEDFEYKNGRIQTSKDERNMVDITIPEDLLVSWQQQIQIVILKNQVSTLLQEQNRRFKMIVTVCCIPTGNDCPTNRQLGRMVQMSFIDYIARRGDGYNGNIIVRNVIFLPNIDWEKIYNVGFEAKGTHDKEGMIHVSRKHVDYLSFQMSTITLITHVRIHNDDLDGFCKKMISPENASN